MWRRKIIKHPEYVDKLSDLPDLLPSIVELVLPWLDWNPWKYSIQTVVAVLNAKGIKKFCFRTLICRLRLCRFDHGISVLGIRRLS
jgi:hypothetical protein